MNTLLAKNVLSAIDRIGVKEICVCPGARNAPLIEQLDHFSFRTYYWHEERSAAFFALGRCKQHLSPTAVMTTSGTAVAELLPATMEAYYSGFALVLLTADRPRRFRGTGAPQTAEQAGIFGIYAEGQDLEFNETCLFKSWDRSKPFHLNVCFEEPF